MFEKRNILVILAIIIVSSIVFLVLPYIVLINDDTRLTSTILFATFLSILWYTIETNKMQKTIKHQLDVSTTARLAITVNKYNEFEIANVGNGVAVNINIDDLIISSKEQIKIKFPSFLYLKPDSKETFEVKNYKDNKEIDFPFFAHLNNSYANKDFFLIIRFEDILKHKRVEYIRLGISGPKLISTEDIKNTAL